MVVLTSVELESQKGVLIDGYCNIMVHGNIYFNNHPSKLSFDNFDSIVTE